MSNNKRKKGNGHALQVVTLCISTAMVLVLLGMVSFIGLCANNLSCYVKENLSITVVFKDNVTNHEAAVVCRKLQQQNYVAHLEYIDRNQALKEQTKALGTDPSEFLGMNPFAPSAEINLKADYANNDSVTVITKNLRKITQVAEVTYQKDLLDSVNSYLNKIMLVMIVVAILLTIISFSLINNSVRLTIYARRFTISTMKLVGASWAFIRKPFLLEALLEGFIAALVAMAVLASGAYALYNYEPDIIAVITWRELAITAGVVLFFGLFISLICVYVSVNRYLNMPTRKLYR